MANPSGFYKPTTTSKYDANGFKLNTPTYDDKGYRLSISEPASISFSGSSSGGNIGLGSMGNALANAANNIGSAIQNANVKPTGGGNGSGSASGSSSSGNALSYLADLYGSYASQRQAALQSAYENAKNNIMGGFDSALGRLRDNLNSAQDALRSSHDNSLQKLKDDAYNSLREAYVNRMLQAKNIGQQLSAMGLSGGASESTLANMSNNYGNARNNINTTLNSNIRDLEANTAQNLANILQAFNNSAANLDSQRASQLANIDMALANGMADAMDKQFSFQTSSGYMNALQDALANQAALQFTPTEAINTVANNSIQQTNANDVSNATNYELIELLRQMGMLS